MRIPLDPSVPFNPDLVAKDIVAPEIEGEVELITKNGPLRDQREALMEGKVDLSKLALVYVHRAEFD